MTDELDELLWQMWLDEHGEEDFDEHKTKIKQAIQALIDKECNKARIDEQSILLKDFEKVAERRANMARLDELENISEYLPEEFDINSRIKELSNKENE